MIFRPLHFVVVSAVLLTTLCAADAHAQGYILLKGKEPIPREPYKTWSIFLVTNQDWLVPENSSRLLQLYRRSEAFGLAIGKDHLAVWFWKQTITGVSGMLENVDVERAISYCEKMGLRPSRGPYLLFTTTYPDENLALTNYSVVELGKNPEDVERMLKRLGDQLVLEGVIREGSFPRPVGSDDFWTEWFSATRHSLTALGLGFRVAIRTPTLSLEAGAR